MTLTRLPIRIRLTLAFTAVMAVVLAGTGLFLYLSLRTELDHSIEQGLRSRSADVTALVQQADQGLRDAAHARADRSSGGFAQIVDRAGRVFDATAGLQRRSLLVPGELRAAQGGATTVQRVTKTPVSGPARLLATPVRAQGKQLTVVVGTSLRDRDKALSDLGTRLLIGGPAALLLAALAGYGLATAALRPVERMRARAAAISPGELHQRLPVPHGNDEVQRLGKTLNAMLHRLEAGQARERAFVADASHELRSPLTMLTTELELIARDRPHGEELDGAIASTITEAKRLGDLAEDLLVLSRAASDQITVAKHTVRAHGLLAAIRRRYPEVLVEEGGQFEFQADPAGIERALKNMVENALRHGATPVRMSAFRRGRRVQIHVRDSGPGFRRDFLEGAFERFSRADAGRGNGGTGLGLAIVAAIAKSHGGSAHAANRPDAGADVWIEIPAG